MCCEKTRTDIFFGGFETHLEHHRSGTLSGYGFSDNGCNRFDRCYACAGSFVRKPL